MKINVLVAKAQKKPEEGWVLQDGTPWPGNDTDNHPGMIQVCQFHYLVISCLMCILILCPLGFKENKGDTV